MIYHDALATLLGPLVLGRYHPVQFAQPKTGGPRWPAIRGVQVGGERFPDICGDGDDDNATPRVQIDIVSSIAAGYAAHNALRQQVLAAMKTFPVPANVELELEQTDEDTETYRSIVDYSLHGSN